MYISLYEITVVDKNNLDILIDGKKVVAKTEEEAKGKAGYYDILKDLGYDSSKLAVNIDKIMNVKEIEEDEE